MSNDIESLLGAVERRVLSLKKDGAPARAVVLSRSYETSIDDLWDAVTNPERLPRWFAPVEGDLWPGGRFKVQDNAGGDIVACEPPDRLSLTWEFSGDISWIDVVLSSQTSGSTRLTLTHVMTLSAHWERYGPGAGGVGWELGLMGLARIIADPGAGPFDEEAFAARKNGRDFLRGSSERWGDAAVRNGVAPATAEAWVARTTAFYTGEAEPR